MKNWQKLLTLPLLLVISVSAQTRITQQNVSQYSKQSNPGTPPTSTAYFYFDGVNLVCVTSSGASCISGGGSGTVSNITTTTPISGGPITTTGAISCPTCAVGPGSSTINHLAKFSGTDGITLADGGAIPAGTVTSVATTSPLTGGTITGSGTVACATCAIGPGSSTASDVAKFSGSDGVTLADGGPGVATDSVAGQGGLLAPFGFNMLWSSAATAASSVNGCRVVQMELDRTVTFTKVGINVVVASNGSHYYFGIYNAAGTTLLRQATFNLTASNGVMTVTVASTTLAPGVYWLMWSSDSASPTVTAYGGLAGVAVNIFNQSRVRVGNSDQTTSSGTLPPAIGTITTSALSPPIVFFEP